MSFPDWKLKTYLPNSGLDFKTGTSVISISGAYRLPYRVKTGAHQLFTQQTHMLEQRLQKTRWVHISPRVRVTGDLRHLRKS